MDQQGLGSLVGPAAVALLQEKLFNDFTAVDHDVSACTKLSATERTNWATFVHSFEAWYNVEPYSWGSYWTEGSLYDTGLQLQTQILAWQQKLQADGCTLTEPLIEQPAPGLDWGTIKTIVVAAAVLGTAFVVYPLITEGVAVSKDVRAHYKTKLTPAT